MSKVQDTKWGKLYFYRSLIYLWGENIHLIHESLLSQDFTHIYYSGYDFDWRLNFDTEGDLARELDIFDHFVDRCARLIYDKGDSGQVYELLLQCEDRANKR